jgi:hypothetical protein
MQVKHKSLRISLSAYETFGWPAEIRVRAKILHTAPRKSPVFPASLSLLEAPTMVLRTLELSSPRSGRRSPESFQWTREYARKQGASK